MSHTVFSSHRHRNGATTSPTVPINTSPRAPSTPRPRPGDSTWPSGPGTTTSGTWSAPCRTGGTGAAPSATMARAQEASADAGLVLCLTYYVGLILLRMSLRGNIAIKLNDSVNIQFTLT